MSNLDLKAIAYNALENLKAQNIQELDVAKLTDMADTMIVASGTSKRQVAAIAGAISKDCKEAGFQPVGVEGHDVGEWALVDLGDIIIHVMLPEMREFYALEQLWSAKPSDADSNNDSDSEA